MKPLDRIPARVKLIFYAIVIIILFLLTGVMNNSHDNHDHGRAFEQNLEKGCGSFNMLSGLT